MNDLLKLLLILGVTVLLLAKRLDLGLVLGLNTILVAVLFRVPLAAWGRSVIRGLVALDTLSLAGAVYLVLVLAELMRRTHAMDQMVAALQALVPDDRLTMALMPLLIGLMPMMGGAMFSAPMVEEVGERLHATPDQKTFVNYWFRHAMEYLFPLYPSLLMIATLLEVNVFEFVRVSWSLSVIALLAGTLFGLWGLRSGAHEDRRSASWETWRQLLSSTWPLLLVIMTVVFLKLNMVLSLVLTIVLLSLTTRVTWSEWPGILKQSFPPHTFSAIFGVMVFKHVMEDTGAVTQIPQALSSLGLPALGVAFVVPMVVGLLTGTAAAALALSVPLVAPLLTDMGTLSAGLWLFVGGFTGVLLSPLHLCLALTKAYFKAGWGPIYRRLIPSVVLVGIAAAGLVFL